MRKNCRTGSLEIKDTEPNYAFDTRLHKLHGNRTGQYAIRINPQYRICFYWIKSHAYEVEITDYH